MAATKHRLGIVNIILASREKSRGGGDRAKASSTQILPANRAAAQLGWRRGTSRLA